MYLQQDGPLGPHKQSQWTQYPPPSPYSGHQWTCDLCKSTFDTLEQRERHQQECSGRNLRAQQAQFSTAVSSRSGYAPRLESAEVPPKVSYPPSSMVHLQRMPGNTRFPSGKRRVVLFWVKESPTLDLEVTYIDNIDGGMVLKWSSQSELFQCEAALSLGQHSGCLTLGRRESILPIKQFFVEEGATSPQKIVISTGQNRIPSRVTQAVGPAVMARDTERDTGTSETIKALERDLHRLTADLDSRNNELVEERLKYNVSLEKYKKETEELSQQVERLTRDNSRLRDAEKNGSSEFPVEMEKLRLQLEAWERKQGEMEREAERAQTEKQVANDYSDYLHGQKKLLEGQLLKLNGELEESLTENAKLKLFIHESSKEAGSSPPPLPTRSKPVPKAPPPQPTKRPPPKECSGGGGEESEK